MHNRFWLAIARSADRILPKPRLLGIGLLGLASSAGATDLSAVRIYTDDDPPYVVVDKSNAVEGGLTVDKVFKVLKKLSLPASTVEAVPWARAYNLAKGSPNVLIFPIAKTRERLQYLDFTFKIIDSKVYFYRLKSRTDIQLTSLNDAKGYTVCVVLGDYRYEYLKEQGFPKLDTTSDRTVNVQRFLAGRCDLLPSTEIGMQSKLSALHQSEDLVVRSIELDNLDSALYAAFNKNTPPAVIKAFKDAALAAD